MDVWLLGAGALLLIGISLWIVWPAQTADSIASTDSAQEVSNAAMLPPQSDEFDDVYTSATADLSAGGVATAGSTAAAMQSIDAATDSEVAPATEPWSNPSLAREGFSTPYPDVYPSSRAAWRRRVPWIPLPAAVMMAICCGIAGACVYAWWHERNQPINRFRREVRSRVRL